MLTFPSGCGIRDSSTESKRRAASRCTQTPRSDAGSERVLIPPPSPRSIPSPHDEEVGSGRGDFKRLRQFDGSSPSPQPSPRSCLAGRGATSAMVGLSRCARSVLWTRIGIAPAVFWVFHCDMNSRVCSRRRFLQTTSILTVGAPFAFSTAANIVSGAEPAAKSLADAKVAIASCKTYGSQEIQAAYGQCFDLLGGIGSLVKGKTVTIKINLTGTDFTPFLNRPVGETYMTHEATAAALAAALFKAGAKRIVFVESTQSRASLEGTLDLAGWDVKALSALGDVQYENTRNLGSGKSYAHIKVPTGGL